MDAICHAVIRMDYMTLALRGYASLGGPPNALDANGALAVADSLFISKMAHYSGTPTVDGPHAGLFFVFQEPSDFGGFALVGAESGGVVTAGGVVWLGQGEYWVPTAWKPSGAIACGQNSFVADTTFVDTAECQGDIAAGTLPTAHDALDVALRTNIAAQFDAHGAFSAYVYLYTPRVGECDPTVAEYIAVLSQARGSG